MFVKRVFLFLLFASVAFAQSPKAHEKYDKALHELENHNLAKAEKLLKEATSESPDWAPANAELGQIYFETTRSGPCIEAYERARELDAKSHQLSQQERRLVNDNLGVVYGIGGQLKKSIAVLEAAIKDDPEYGEYEYNLACSYSESGDLDKALAHLNRAWELRSSFKFPDVTKDNSFQRWKDDPRFQEAASKMVI